MNMTMTKSTIQNQSLRNCRTRLSFSTQEKKILGFSRGEMSKKKTITIISGQGLNFYLCFVTKLQMPHEGL